MKIKIKPCFKLKISTPEVIAIVIGSFFIMLITMIALKDILCALNG